MYFADHRPKGQGRRTVRGIIMQGLANAHSPVAFILSYVFIWRSSINRRAL